jgi:hypothetical protein
MEIDDTNIYGFEEDDPAGAWVAYQQAVFLEWCNRQSAVALSLPEALALFEGVLYYAPKDKGHLE